MLRDRLASTFGWLDRRRRTVLVTAHRRESLGQRLAAICEALAAIGERKDVSLVFPVHPNPGVRREVMPRLGGRPNIHLIEPVAYEEMVHLLECCHFVLTDSGGLQEEAPSFGKPVLVMRETTERSEAIEAGVARLVTTDRDRIVTEATRLLDDDKAYSSMSKDTNPFGDGQAGLRIAQSLST